MSGHKPFSILRAEINRDPARRHRVDEMKRAMRDARALTQVRTERGFTQQDVADALNVSQPNISRIEHESDVYLSTLRDYVEALGGELELTARFPDGEVIKVG